MVDPVNADEGKGDEIQAQRGQNSPETGESVLMRHLQLEHHDGDDYRDDSVGEGFEASWSEDMVTHGCSSGRSIQRDWPMRT